MEPVINTYSNVLEVTTGSGQVVELHATSPSVDFIKRDTFVPSHTHTTDEVYLADDTSVTLTSELEEIKGIAFAAL